MYGAFTFQSKEQLLDLDDCTPSLTLFIPPPLPLPLSLAIAGCGVCGLVFPFKYFSELPGFSVQVQGALDFPVKPLIALKWNADNICDTIHI